jgi:membrane protease YdiL (CAAX protease family)
LAALGALLCLVYEATGSIRIIVIAHGLFNLNTVLVVLSGLSQLP